MNDHFREESFIWYCNIPFKRYKSIMKAVIMYRLTFEIFLDHIARICSFNYHPTMIQLSLSIHSAFIQFRFNFPSIDHDSKIEIRKENEYLQLSLQQ